MISGPRNGFTLIELLVVLLIIGVVFSLAPAAYHRVLPGLQAKTAASDLASVLREARGLAVRDNRETVVVVDTEARVYRAGTGATAESLPEAVKITLVTAASEQLSDVSGRIRFFPDGTSTGGRVTVAREAREYHVDVDWLTGRVRVYD